MAKFNMNFVEKDPLGDVLQIGFGDPATNVEICQEVKESLQTLFQGKGGRRLLINGPASLPVAFVLSHAVAHLYEQIGIWDPKLRAYVIVIAHGSYHVGDLIHATNDGVIIP